MRQIRIVGVAVVVTLALGAAAASDAWGVTAPHWGGKGMTENRACVLYLLWSYGWVTESECLGGGATGYALGFDRYLEVRSSPMKSTKAVKFANTSQSIECGEMSSKGGLFDLEGKENMSGMGVEEMTLTKCKVWNENFKSEEKLCNVNSVEGEKESEAGVIKIVADTELVYLDKEGVHIGNRFFPSDESGKVLAVLNFKGTCTQSGKQELLGEVIAEIPTINEEKESDALVFPTTAIGKFWKWSLPETLTENAVAALKLYKGVTTTLSAEATMELEPKQNFGAFK